MTTASRDSSPADKLFKSMILIKYDSLQSYIYCCCRVCICNCSTIKPETEPEVVRVRSGPKIYLHNNSVLLQYNLPEQNS